MGRQANDKPFQIVPDERLISCDLAGFVDDAAALRSAYEQRLCGLICELGVEGRCAASRDDEAIMRRT